MKLVSTLSVHLVATMWPVLVLLIIAFAEALEPRIVGGKPTTVTKHPYQVSIYYNGQHNCGGSIISKDWILTAAHCVYGLKPALFQIRVKSTYHDKGGEVIGGIKTLIFHEWYDDDTYSYDVGLIKLPSPISFTSEAKRVTLPSANTNVPTGSLATVTGWGRISADGARSNVLQVLDVPVVDQKICQKIYAFYNPVTSEMMCAGHMAGGKDTCQGDSGGPLVYKGDQIGIVSWGAQCAKAGYPGVYTRVSAVRSWIMKKTGV